MTNAAPSPPREPLFNVPPLTLGLAALLLVVHMIRHFVPFMDEWALHQLALIPADFTLVPWTILSYAMLHFGWLHFGINMTSLFAFGSGVERLFGKTWFLFIFIGGALFGALLHCLLFADSLVPLGGASAGISALFGALLPLLARGRPLIGAIMVFVLTNLAIGIVGMGNDPDVSIAWQAHLGGFVFGLVASLIYKKSPR